MRLPKWLIGLVLAAGDAPGFALDPENFGFPVPETLSIAARWSASTGLADGLQVAVEPGFAADLGAVTPADVAALEQAVGKALTMWATPALAFEVSFENPAVVEGTHAGLEIDVFAVASTHPAFAGTDFFGRTYASVNWSASRPLTNGQSAEGFVIDRADVYVNKDLVLQLAGLFGFTAQQRLDALTRLLGHEVGHALGLAHPNGNDPYGFHTNYDQDTVATNPIVIDAADPFTGFGVSSVRDDAAIMSNRPCGHPFVAPCPALFDTTLHADDAGGRDVLYPAVLPVAAGAVLVSGPSFVAVSDPASGATDLLHSGAPLTAGDGVAVDAAGDVLVADSGSGSIWRIDAQGGGASLVASGGSLLVPNRVAVAPDGTLYVADGGLGGAVVEVDPGTGSSSLLANVPGAFDLAIDAAGSTLYVAAGDAVVAVALPGGSQTPITSSGLLSVNLGIAVEASGDLVVLTYVDGTFTNRLVRVSADGATQTLLHTSALNAGYYDLALDAAGAALVVGAASNQVARIDLASGVATTIDALSFPFGVAAVHPSCADALDNDGDGFWDAGGVAPDPGCRVASSPLEDPQCDNDLDDDGDGRIDWDGPGTPDPQCDVGWRNREQAAQSCGLGGELALLLPLLAGLRGLRGRADG